MSKKDLTKHPLPCPDCGKSTIVTEIRCDPHPLRHDVVWAGCLSCSRCILNDIYIHSGNIPNTGGYYDSSVINFNMVVMIRFNNISYDDAYNLVFL